jgi:hypothetical protein
MNKKKQQVNSKTQVYVPFPGSDYDDDDSDDTFIQGLNAMIGITSQLMKDGEISWNLQTKSYCDNTFESKFYYVIRINGG